MKRNLILILPICFMATLWTGCVSQSSKVEDLPGIDTTGMQINTLFMISEDPVGGSANSHKNNEYLAVTLKNLSDTPIIFSGDFIKIFGKNNDQWVPVSNSVIYSVDQQILPTAQEFPPGAVIPVFPSVSGMTKPTLIRIFFEGKTQETNENVGAYMDITITP